MNDYGRLQVLFSFVYVINRVGLFAMPIAEWANEWDLSRRSIGSLWSRDVA